MFILTIINKKKFCLLPYVFGVLSVIIILIFTTILVNLEHNRFLEANRNHVLNELSTTRAKLEGVLNERIFLMRGLVAYISTQNSDITQKEFEDLTKVIVAKVNGIPSAALFKNSICTHLYPLEGQEEALGFEPLKIPEAKEAFERAIKTKKTVLSGPVDLFPQGGMVFITRTPVFLTPSNGVAESGEYWGMVSIGIEQDILLKEAGILNKENDLEYSIRGYDGLGEKGQFFWGKEAIFTNNPVSLNVTLPNGSWQLAAIPVHGWPFYSLSMLWITIGGIIIAFLTGLLIFSLTKTLLQLNQEIKERKEVELQLTKTNKELSKLASLDGLTQIANRYYFDTYLKKEWNRLSRQREPLSLILCDVDYFKKYNDRYGHPQGDECLKQVAKAIEKAAQRPADLAARFGGEEFAMILPKTNLDGAIKVAKNLQKYISNLKLEHKQSQINQYITLSIGIAHTHCHPFYSSQKLIDAADHALYRSKNKGRNCYDYTNLVVEETLEKYNKSRIEKTL
ncbi:diguanylate cyclase domain-containing protein [Crocosphaera chwakensis]|uniref:GGDEF family protein n=1 Tax=Crocosphaera chwakensis CCY0110 TaxID=391612 RepID=A3IMR3_9CHRO|nr:diguanylate cyclase [Crocosphaera chwakensis]EAZ92166.1 GGDEF family protein [Crocosphaera chwakensis CCY0110]